MKLSKFVQPLNAFCIKYATQSAKFFILNFKKGSSKKFPMSVAPMSR